MIKSIAHDQPQKNFKYLWLELYTVGFCYVQRIALTPGLTLGYERSLGNAERSLGIKFFPLIRSSNGEDRSSSIEKGSLR